MPVRVSLGLPVYNGESFIAQAIRSLLDQDFEDFELIISDNASTDRTAEICRAFADKDGRIRYFRNATNIGAGRNYNRTFELSSGEFFKWAAHDDWISPGFLRAGVAALDAHPEASLAYGPIRYVDLKGDVIAFEVETEDVSVSKVFPDMRDMPVSRRFRLAVDAGGADNVMFGLIRRCSLAQTSLHRDYYMSDRALLAELALLGAFVHVPEMELYNRDHPDRSINITDKQARATWQASGGRKRPPLEHLKLLAHLVEVAVRYRRLAPLSRTLPLLLAWAASPLQLSRYLLEAVGLVLPSARQRLRRAGWSIARAFQKPAGTARD